MPAKRTEKERTERPLYDVLGLTAQCSATDISRAYRRLALQHHPDRNPGGSEMFRKVCDAYTVLSDPQQRRLYDKTGRVPNAGSADEEVDLAQRSVEISDQMKHFFEQYRGSAEEQADFMKQFEATNGNFSKMIKERLLFDNGVDGEVERLFQLGVSLLAEAKLSPQPHKKNSSGSGSKSAASNVDSPCLWSTSTTIPMRKKLERHLRKEREEAEAALAEMSPEPAHTHSADGNLGALQVLMQQRQRQAWDNMLDVIESKYTNERSARKKSSVVKKKRGRED